VHGLYYYRARYYDPSIGRFISSDPIEFQAGDFNFYRYVGNDPVNFVDPSGLAVSSPDNHVTTPTPSPTFELYPGQFEFDSLLERQGLIDVSFDFTPIGKILSGIAKGIEGLFQASKGITIIKESKSASKSTTVHRGDGRSSDEIFKEGFKPKDANSKTSLEDYVNKNESSKYVSTSKDLEVAENFAKSERLKTGEGYVYAISKETHEGIDVNKVLDRNIYRHENEIAFPGGISPDKIQGVTKVGDNYSTLNPNYKK